MSRAATGDSFHSATSAQSSASPNASFGVFTSSGGGSSRRRKEPKGFNFVADLGTSPTSAFAAFNLKETQHVPDQPTASAVGVTQSNRNLSSAFDQAQDHAAHKQQEGSGASHHQDPPQPLQPQVAQTPGPAFTLGSFATTPSRKHKTPGKGGSKTPVRPFAQPFSFVPGSSSFTAKQAPEPAPAPAPAPAQPQEQQRDVPPTTNAQKTSEATSEKDQTSGLFGGSLFTGFSPMSWSPSSSASTGMPFKPYPSMANGAGRKPQVPTAAPGASAAPSPFPGFTFNPSPAPSLFKEKTSSHDFTPPADDCTLPRDSGPSAAPPSSTPPPPFPSFTNFSPWATKPAEEDTPGIHLWSFPSPSPFKPQAANAPTWPTPAPVPPSPSPPSFTFGTTDPPPPPPQPSFTSKAAFDIGAGTPSRRSQRVGSKKNTPSSKNTRSQAAVHATQSSQVPITPSFVTEPRAKEGPKNEPASFSPSRTTLRARRAFEEPKAAPTASPMPTITPPAPPREDRTIKARAISSSFKDSGNKFFNQALYVEAETAYSRAIAALEAVDELDGVEMAVLHSNRAGARIMIGKPVSALEDAKKAVSMDPTFIRAAIRVITCYMKLGECSVAQTMVQDVLSKLDANQPCYQDALRKAKEVEDSVKDLARIKCQIDAEGLSRDRLSEILVSAQPLEHFIAYSEELAAIKFRIFFQSGKFHDALRSLEVSHDGREHVKNHPWRYWAEVQVKYHNGDLQGSLASCSSLLPLLNLDREATYEQGRYGLLGALSLIGLPTSESLQGLIKHMKALLELKEAGNAAIKSGSFQEAISKYSEAINMGGSAAYSAVLHSNRAAAHQGMGSLVEAVADCGRSRALDPFFLRAHTRMASLFQELRRPEFAETLLSDLLTSAKAQLNPVKMSGNESSEVASHIQNLKAMARWQKTPDHYKALSLDRSCADDEVRRAYRKAALKFHPDKALSACRYALDLPSFIQPASSLSCNLKVCGTPEIESRLREEASILFNVINQANEELSDQSRRRKVDMLLTAEAPPPSHRPSSSPYDYGMYSGGEARASYHPGAYRYTSGSYSGRSSQPKPPPPPPGGHTSSSYSRYFNQQPPRGPTRPSTTSGKTYSSTFQGRGGWYDEHEAYEDA